MDRHKMCRIGDDEVLLLVSFVRMPRNVGRKNMDSSSGCAVRRSQISRILLRACGDMERGEPFFLLSSPLSFPHFQRLEVSTTVFM